MRKTRRRFSREYKLEAVRQLTAGKRLADVARDLGVDAQVLRRWQEQVEVDPVTAFPGNGRSPTPRAIGVQPFAFAFFVMSRNVPSSSWRLVGTAIPSSCSIFVL